MFFEKLKSRVAETTELLKALEVGSPEHQLNFAKLMLYEEIHKWTFDDGTWAKKPSTAKRVFDTLDLGYDEAAKMYKTSPQSLRSSLWQASQSISEILGFDILRSIDECSVVLIAGSNQLEVALSKLQNITLSFFYRTQGYKLPDGIFVDFVLKAIPEREEWKFNKVGREDFVNALKILQSLTKQGVVDTIEEIEMDVWETVMYILTNQDSQTQATLIELQRLFYEFIYKRIDEVELRGALDRVD